MYLEDGRCAQCGKKLDDTYKSAPHNTPWERLAINRVRPYFCSSKCSGNAIQPYLPEGYGDPHPKIRAVKEDYTDRLSDEDTDRDHEIFREAVAKIDELRHEQGKRDHGALENACITVVRDFAEAFVASPHNNKNSRTDYKFFDAPKPMHIDVQAVYTALGHPEPWVGLILTVDGFVTEHSRAKTTQDFYSENPTGAVIRLLKEVQQQVPHAFVKSLAGHQRIGWIELLDVCPDPTTLFRVALEEFNKGEGVTRLRKQLCEAAGVSYTSTQSDDELLYSLILTPKEIVAKVFRGISALWLLFVRRVGKFIPLTTRYEHTHILGGSGSGKTTLIQQLIFDDLKSHDPPAMVVIDPKGLLASRLRQLAVFHPTDGRLANRLVVVDPADAPALGMFDVHSSNLNHLIESFAYIFSTADARLTQRQSIPFSYVVRLVFSMGGDIDTLMDVLDDEPKKKEQSRFLPAIEALSASDRGAKRFFERDFFNSAFSETRKQIKTRLYEVMSRPELLNMLGAAHSKLNMTECLQQRKIVLVNTSMNKLGVKGSQLLGRYIISLTLNAAFSRTDIPRNEWTPSFLYIDEFQDFADEEKTPEILRLAREYNLGVILAHQNMYCDELNNSIRTSISTNTSIKFCASPEGLDLNYMARDLRCEPGFLSKQQKKDGTVFFASFARGAGMETAISQAAFIERYDQEPKMDAEALKQSIATNRTRMQPIVTTRLAPVAAALPPQPTPPPAPKPEPKRPDTHTESGTDW